MALFGRKINHAEHQLAFIEMLRLITDGRISPEEAVRAYHGVLQAKGLKPHRPLEKDLQLTDQAMSYGGGGPRSHVPVPDNPLAKTKPAPEAEGRQGLATLAAADAGDWPVRADNAPDFEKMTSAQRQAFHQARLKRRFG